MGVYIRGMEMPINEKETIIRILPDGTVLDNYGQYLAITAVPVPPHGRLGDLDALKALFKRVEAEKDHTACSMEQIYETLDETPAIIPAEEERA